MDPNACMREMISNYHGGINSNDADALWWAKHHATELISWLIHGGFAPGNFDSRDVVGFARIIRHLAQSHEDRLSAD